MKKKLLFLMLGMMALCLLPQNLFASNPTVTISGNKVTVNSTSAGSLATYVNSLSEAQKNDLKVDEIVFVGKFNQADFQALQGFPYKTVDMGEAKIVNSSSSSSNYTFYHDNYPSNGSDGQKCVVGATKFVSSQNVEWQDKGSEPPTDGNIDTPSGWTTNNINTDHLNEYYIGDYVKIPSAYNYWRKDNVWEEVKYPLIHEGYDGDNAAWYAYTWSTDTDQEWISLADGCSASVLKSKVIFVRMRPNVAPSWENAWNQTEDLDVNPNQVYVITGWNNGNGKLQGSWQGDDKTYDNWTVDGLRYQKGNNNQIVKIQDGGQDKFFRYTGTTKWTSIDEGTAISESAENYKSIESPDWTDFNGNNHLDQLGDPPVYIRFASAYTYYQKVAGSIEWVESTYNDGDSSNNYYPSREDMPTPTEAYQQAFAGGTVYEYQNGSWAPAGSSDNDTYNYSLMKFSYWSGTIEKAVTSKYADNTISGEIFQNCKNLTEVDYKAGNVTGFGDHKTESGYASGLKVTIGKNVTSIDASAFMRCTALSTLEFDKDYANGNTDMLDGVSYPLELTIGQEAFLECTNLTGVEFPNRVVSIGNSAFKGAGTAVSEMTVSFERRSGEGAGINFDRDLTIGEAAFQNCTKLKTLELPIRLTTMGKEAFNGTSNLTTVTIREDIEDARIEIIPEGAFQLSGITSLTVPRSVTEIQANAFGSCYNLETLTFQEQVAHNPQQPLIIRTGAFAGGSEEDYKLKDVFVEIDPDDRLLVCEYNAFHFEAIVGQTDVTSEQIATLHFPEENWNYYAGDWKRGLAFAQNNLNSFKDGFSGNRGAQQPTAASNGLVSGCEPANGWQQFAITDTGIEIELPKGKFVRSYSVSKPCEIPMFITGNGREPFAKFYRVTAFSDGWEPGDAIDDKDKATAAQRTATATEVDGYIPMNTGLLMVGLGDPNQSYLLYPAYLSEETYSKTYTYATSGDDANLLQPTNDEVVTINPTIPYPFRSKADIEFRIFGFKANSTGDGGVFLRSQPNVKMKPNQAYLQLPVSMFHWGNESGDNQSGLDDTQSAKDITLTFFVDENTNAISLQPASANEDNGCFYTLQGVKVERPTAKGIYIYKGKKIMVK